MSLGQHPGVPKVDSLQVLGEQKEREPQTLMRHPNCPVFSASKGPTSKHRASTWATGGHHSVHGSTHFIHFLQQLVIYTDTRPSWEGR